MTSRNMVDFEETEMDEKAHGKEFINTVIFYMQTAAYNWLVGLSSFSFLLLMLTLISLLVYRNNHSDRQSIFFALFEDRIRRVFRSQSEETLTTIRTGINSILREEPERPSVILLLAPSGCLLTANCLAKTLASSVVEVFLQFPTPLDDIVLRGSEFSNFEDYWKLYECLSNAMEESKVVVLLEFERVHPHTASVFCHLADDAYSPYPQSVVFVVCNVLEHFSKDLLKKTSPVLLAESFLSDTWELRLEKDLLAELLLRLTGRTVIVEEEKMELLLQAGV